MKQSNLISILILFFSLLSVQSVVADDPTGISNNCLTFNNLKTIYGDFTLNISSYPCNKISFSTNLTSAGLGSKQQIKVSSNVGNTGIFNITKSSSSYNLEISTNATSIQIAHEYGGITREIKDIKVHIAPHTKLNTTSLTFNTSVNDTDGDIQTVSFHSFLTGASGMTISIVDANDKPTDVDGQVSLVDATDGNATDGNTTDGIITYKANQLGKINEKSFQIKFVPNKIQTNANCTIKITNPKADINSEIKIPVTLNSSLSAPTLSCTSYGYTFVNLSWNEIPGADKYILYDDDTKIKEYTNTTKSATISGLEYGSRHKYTIKSVVDSALSNPSNAIEVTTYAYPSVQNIEFTNVTQNSFTVNWSPVTNLPANHKVIQYHIHLWQPYASETEGTFIKAIDTTGTSCDFTGLIDNTQYTAYVDVEYQYTLNGETKNVHEQRWSSATITTTSFIPTTPFDGEKMYKGEWYRVLVNSTKTLVSGHHTYATNGTYEFDLKYPCNNLSYQAWLNKSANIVHSIHDNATNNTKELQKDPDYLDANRYNHSDAIDTSIKKVIFTGHQGGTGDKTIYLDNIYAKIAPHIIMSNDVNFDFTDTG